MVEEVQVLRWDVCLRLEGSGGFAGIRFGEKGGEGRRLSSTFGRRLEFAAGGDRMDLMPQILHRREQVDLMSSSRTYDSFETNLRARASGLDAFKTETRSFFP